MAYTDKTADFVYKKGVFWQDFDELAENDSYLVQALHGLCQGRLTLESGVPISVTDQTAKSTLYFTPYTGNMVILYDTVNSIWVPYSFIELSLDISAYVANTNYDIFMGLSAGVPALSGVAWTDGTTRATAISLHEGVYSQTADRSKRYLGTIRITGTTGQCEVSFGKTPGAGGSVPKIYLWNMYNRVKFSVAVLDSTDSWNYTTATWRLKNNNANNAAYFVVGLNEVSYSAINTTISSNGSAGVDRQTGISLDSTSAIATGSIASVVNPAAAEYGVAAAYFDGVLGIGYHYLGAIERSNASGTTAWYGDGGSATIVQTGMIVHGMY